MQRPYVLFNMKMIHCKILKQQKFLTKDDEHIEVSFGADKDVKSVGCIINCLISIENSSFLRLTYGCQFRMDEQFWLDCLENKSLLSLSNVIAADLIFLTINMAEAELPFFIGNIGQIDLHSNIGNTQNIVTNEININL